MDEEDLALLANNPTLSPVELVCGRMRVQQDGGKKVQQDRANRARARAAGQGQEQQGRGKSSRAEARAAGQRQEQVIEANSKADRFLIRKLN